MLKLVMDMALLGHCRISCDIDFYGGRQLPFKSHISHSTIFNFKISDLNISNFKISNLNISSQVVVYSTLLIFYER